MIKNRERGSLIAVTLGRHISPVPDVVKATTRSGFTPSRASVPKVQSATPAINVLGGRASPVASFLSHARLAARASHPSVPTRNSVRIDAGNGRTAVVIKMSEAAEARPRGQCDIAFLRNAVPKHCTKTQTVQDPPVPSAKTFKKPAQNRKKCRACTVYHPLGKGKSGTALASKPRESCCQGGTCTVVAVWYRALQHPTITYPTHPLRRHPHRRPGFSN
jgi:hypothetical protein